MCRQQQFFLGMGVSGKEYDERIIVEIKQALQRSTIDLIVGIATLDKKRQHPLITALAALFKADMLSFSAFDLEAQTPLLMNPSGQLYARLGCHGVAEAAAFAAAGEGGRLVIPKTICHKATFAVAISGE